jgi:Flp pilus assembly protein TadD
VQPKHPEALHYLGLLAYQNGRYETAAKLIGESVGAQDDNPAAYSNLGNALAMLERFTEAEAAFRNALRTDPHFADALFNLGNILRQQEKLADAENAYRRVIALNPIHVGALNNLGNMLCLRGREQDAADAFLALGDVLQDLGRTQDAAASTASRRPFCRIRASR